MDLEEKPDLKPPHMPENIKLHPRWMGVMNQKNAVDFVRDSKPGTYVFRQEEGLEGTFFMTTKGRNGVFTHVQFRPEEGRTWCIERSGDKLQFEHTGRNIHRLSSLGNIAEKFADRFGLPKPDQAFFERKRKQPDTFAPSAVPLSRSKPNPIQLVEREAHERALEKRHDYIKELRGRITELERDLARKDKYVDEMEEEVKMLQEYNCRLQSGALPEDVVKKVTKAVKLLNSIH